MSATIPGHTCNVHCRDGRHADLAYAEAAATNSNIAHAFEYRYPVRVLAVDPAPEAPDDAAAARMGLRLDRDPLTPSGAARSSTDRRLLVTWEMAPWPAAIRALLTATGLTQRALADRLGIALRTVEDWHGGRRTPTGLYRRAVERAMREAGVEPPV